VVGLAREVTDFRMQDTTQEEIVQAITGASDNVVARRQARTQATASDTQERQ